MARAWSGKLAGLALGAAGSVLLVWLVLTVAEWAIGLDDPGFRYENALDMWQPDPHAGYSNHPNFEATSWGAIPVRTNSRGFRGLQPTADRKTDGVLRIVGLGDSIMWGTGVRIEDSLLGQLDSRLREEGVAVEVINAAVVGYSSLQALRLLEERVVPLEPDVVVLNFCLNDLLPTEDPFEAVRPLHDAYLAELIEYGTPPLSPELREEAKRLRRILRKSKRVWSEIHAASAQRTDRMMELLVDRPIAKMAERVTRWGGRFIVLLIPGRDDGVAYQRHALRLEAMLARAGAESLNLIRDLRPTRPQARSESESRRPLGFTHDIPPLDRILRWRGSQAAQRRDVFVDAVHPTRRGNAIIAERLARLLVDAEAR